MRRSRRQGQLDVLFAGLTLLLLWPLLSGAEWLLLLLAAAALCYCGRRSWSPVQLGCRAGQWWWRHHGVVRPLRWRPGSVRRPGLIIWQYGRWPWQRLLIRPDSLPVGDYRRLLLALYQG